MPQSLARVIQHLVFSTKDRRRVFVMQEMRDATAGYITGDFPCPNLSPA